MPWGCSVRKRRHEGSFKEMKPSQFEDLSAILALYRPGPMGSGMLDDFIKRKRGEQKVSYPHPNWKGCLKPTYGIILLSRTGHANCFCYRGI